MKPLGANGIKGNWASLLLPINKGDLIDFGRLKSQVERIIAFGVDGLYTNGTAGEFHTQSEAEFDQVQELVAGLCNAAGLPFQIGVSHMSAQISLARLKRIAHLQPSAVQVVLPDWVSPTQEEAVIFMEVMAAAADPIGLVLYNPPHAKQRFSPTQFGQLARRVPALRGGKVLGGDSEWYQAMRTEMGGLSVFVPGHFLATEVREGAHGSYSNVACIQPGAAQRWTDLMRTDLAEALAIESRIQNFMTEHVAPFGTEGYSNSALDKLLATMGGWADIGPRLRWPYQSLQSDDARALREPFFRAVPEFEAWMASFG